MATWLRPSRLALWMSLLFLCGCRAEPDPAVYGIRSPDGPRFSANASASPHLHPSQRPRHPAAASGAPSPILSGDLASAAPAAPRVAVHAAPESPAPRQTAPAPRKPPAPARVSGVVVLDPGHGGRDGGAEGRTPQGRAVWEKDVTLAIALAAADDLRARGASVILTRTEDRYVSLEDRSRIANRHAGAVFVSIHANATKTGQNRPAWMVEGVETYILPPQVTDEQRARRAAALYNAGSSDSSAAALAARHLPALRGQRAESARLARLVQDEMTHGLGEEDRGVKQRNLAVLRETFFGPAVLAEVGFLSHPPTAAKLAAPEHRRRVAGTLADGIARHLAAR